ncbi:tetratricopeptide repeat protein [Noviherbaspirillum saxi]|nr:tetratricopeptide repeat protein [Noviherbaspirillum saxi]
MKKMAWLVPVLLPFAQPAWPADDLISSQMADQARTWQQKDRDDLAAEIWRKLLRTDPRHPEALVRLGMIEARAGNTREAEALYNRARRLPTPPAGLQELAAALGRSKASSEPKPAAVTPKSEPLASRPAEAINKTTTDKAGSEKAASDKRSDAAANKPAASKPTETAAAKPSAEPRPDDAATRENSDKPAETRGTSRISIQQFQTSSAVNEKWPETRQSLEDLIRKNPDDAAYRAALARHLTVRDATRREGVRQFGALPSGTQTSPDTRKVWRQALLALEPRSGDQSLYSAYLQRFPNDAEIRNRLRALPQQEPERVAPTNTAPQPAAMIAAPAPSAPDVLDGGNNQGKAAALVKQALADERAAAHGAAAAKLENAMLLDPANTSIRLALARQYERLGAMDSAGSLLDDLLASNPDHPDGLHARANVLASQKKWLDGLIMLDRIPAAQRTADMVRDQRQMWLNVQVLRVRQLYRQGETGQAQSLMERLQFEAQSNNAMLSVVAGGWVALGQSGKGLRIMREVLGRSGPNNVATRITYAEMLLNTYQDAELSAVLRDLAAPGRLTTMQQEEVNRIILSYTLRLTEALRESGRLAEAGAMIRPVAQRTSDTRVVISLARIHRATAEHAQALTLVETAITREPDDFGHRLLAAEIAIDLKALDKAEAHAAAALRLAPNHPRALSAAGRIERARGNLPRASDYFQRAYTMEWDRNSFVPAPRNLLLRLVDEGPVALAPRPGTPSSSQPNLLPIPAPVSSLDPTQPNPYVRSLAMVPGAILSGHGPARRTEYSVEPAIVYTDKPVTYSQPVAQTQAASYAPVHVARYEPEPARVYPPNDPLYTDPVFRAPTSGSSQPASPPVETDNEGVKLKMATSTNPRLYARATRRSP